MAEVYGKGICKKSFEEMRVFVRHANAIGESPMLFGGWAVYHYNPYAGSRDVDFAVSDENFDRLVDFLVARGYGQRQARLFKEDVFFDLYKKSEEIGGEKNRISFSLLYEGCERIYLRGYDSPPGREEVLLPSLGVLAYFKLVALEERSVPKDRSDAIALLLKSSEEDLHGTAGLMGERPKLRERLLTLRNDAQSLSFVTAPTKKELNRLNQKVKTLMQSLPRL
ncbi:MAG: hypothetical protein V1787_00215 [Candidatus Micrarchaeota archaeon]